MDNPVAADAWSDRCPPIAWSSSGVASVAVYPSAEVTAVMTFWLCNAAVLSAVCVRSTAQSSQLVLGILVVRYGMCLVYQAFRKNGAAFSGPSWSGTQLCTHFAYLIAGNLQQGHLPSHCHLLPTWSPHIGWLTVELCLRVE